MVGEGIPPGLNFQKDRISDAPPLETPRLYVLPCKHLRCSLNHIANRASLYLNHRNKRRFIQYGNSQLLRFGKF